MKTVGEIVGGRPPRVAVENDTVAAAVRRMVEHRIGALPVVSAAGDGRVVGMFTERDLMTRVVDPGLDPQTTPIKDVMTSEKLVTIEPGASYEKARALMRVSRCRHIMVVEKDRLVGVTGMRDVLETNLEETTDELKMLQAYVFYVPPELNEGG